MNLPGDPREHYVAGMSWVKGASELVLHQLNRLQNKLDVYLGDARSGEVARLFQDADKAWVSVEEQPQWTHDGRTLVILSERDGWQHAYAVSRTDRTARLLTPEPADVIRLVSMDAKDEWLYYIASPANATQRFLYRARLDGTVATERVTPADQPGTHGHAISPDGRFSFHTYSTFEKAPVTTVIRLPTHEIIRVVEDNQALQGTINELVRPTEFFTIEVSAGVNVDGWMIRPRDLDFTPDKRYPVIVYVYGEPGNVTVTDAWSAVRTPLHWALADAGYIVVSMDNRGTPAPKGRNWRKVVYGDFNSIAAQEQTAALKNLLQQRPYLDTSRIGVWGHSGGGANTLNLLFRSPEIYHVGVASAPVTDQTLYDTIYQERFMGLPAQNVAGYRNGSPITFAEGLRGKLLLIHGAADDNVHYQNSERLINRLVELQKPFDLMVYPNGSHALNEGKGYALHRYRLMARYFQANLPAGGRTATPEQSRAP
jgi:dipeptidyl-peptidase-4